jgi:CheY-like chemotaxis protein
LDGFTLVQQLRAEEQFSQLPIIALTAYAMRGDREKALAAGCSGFISKPIHTQKFIQTIQEYLGE